MEVYDGMTVRRIYKLPGRIYGNGGGPGVRSRQRRPKNAQVVKEMRLAASQALATMLLNRHSEPVFEIGAFHAFWCCFLPRVSPTGEYHDRQLPEAQDRADGLRAKPLNGLMKAPCAPEIIRV